MASLRDDMDEYAAVVTLMREALAVRRLLLGENHPSMQDAVLYMQRNNKSIKNLAEEAAAAEEKEHEEEAKG
jgi:hypothetical protein